MATATREQPRLKTRYETELRPALQEELGLGNVMEVPRLEKIVLNCGVGRATQQRRCSTARSPTSTSSPARSRSSRGPRSRSPAFKLREGNAIGAKVTLRGDRMWEFYDRLVSLAIPRIRDFRGLNPNSFDGRGQLHVRRDRAADLPGDRLRQDRHGAGHGHHDRDHRRHRRRGARAAPCARVPVPPRPKRRGNRAWRRRHSSRSSSASRSSRSAATRGAAGAAGARSVYRKFGLCRICFREIVARGRGPRHDQGVVVRGAAP